MTQKNITYQTEIRCDVSRTVVRETGEIIPDEYAYSFRLTAGERHFSTPWEYGDVHRMNEAAEQIRKDLTRRVVLQEVLL